jgi:pantoate--beta-alanine ligase
MNFIEKIEEIREISRNSKKNNLKVAVVPTMGALHEGHLSLIEKAKQLADIVIVTIFVNPKQFAPNEDLDKYPKNLEKDIKLANNSGADFIFSPSPLEIYPVGYSTSIKVNKITEVFEGEFRPQFFEGVATVCAKLFIITEPDLVIFGQKDYQQCIVIKQLIKDLHLPIEFYMEPTVRESDGLAKSSRNVYLSKKEREKSGILFIALEEAKKAISLGETNRKKINAIMHKKLREVKEIKIDYASVALADDLSQPEFFLKGDKIVLLIACYLNKTRLIDNSIVTI